MGVFDDKQGDTKSDGFSDVTSDSSASGAASAPADFSDVTSGSSSTASAAAEQSYTVKSGDSLSKIAKHLYGDANSWHKIYDANRDKINNPDLIHPGQVLTIPSA